MKSYSCYHNYLPTVFGFPVNIFRLIFLFNKKYALILIFPTLQYQTFLFFCMKCVYGSFYGNKSVVRLNRVIPKLRQVPS